MPIYEFKCNKCGEVTEQFLRSTMPKMSECPKCKGQLFQLFSPPALFMGKMPFSGYHKFTRPNDGKKP